MLYRLRWAGHVVRMDHTRLPKCLLFGQLNEAKRCRYKPKRRFQGCIKDNLKKAEIDRDSWKSRTLNRASWRFHIHQGSKKLNEHQLKNREL